MMENIRKHIDESCRRRRRFDDEKHVKGVETL